MEKDRTSVSRPESDQKKELPELATEEMLIEEVVQRLAGLLRQQALIKRGHIWDFPKYKGWTGTPILTVDNCLLNFSS